MIIRADARHLPLADRSVQCVMTSPPYLGLRNYYEVVGQIGLERSPEEYVAALVDVFREVRRVLRDYGVLWLVLGDSYASSWPGNRRNVIGNGSLPNGKRAARPPRLGARLKKKDLIGIPWAVAFALRQDGWWLRCDCIWAKPNPTPEAVTDRPTRNHEYLFLLTKHDRYSYNADAIREGNANRRSVWTVNTESYLEVHHATFPQALIAPASWPVPAGRRGARPVWRNVDHRDGRGKIRAPVGNGRTQC
jgi:DNA modification methylase